MQVVLDRADRLRLAAVLRKHERPDRIPAGLWFRMTSTEPTADVLGLYHLRVILRMDHRAAMALGLFFLAFPRKRSRPRPTEGGSADRGR